MSTIHPREIALGPEVSHETLTPTHAYVHKITKMAAIVKMPSICDDYP